MNPRAQEAIITTGGNAIGSGGSVSYTVGQIVYTTNIGTNGAVAQGVQQPYEISVVIGIVEAQEISLICSVFPNPTKDFLTLKIENYNKDNLSYQLFDINGKHLEYKEVKESETIIKMKNFVSATYFLKITQGNKIIKTFRIIKN